MIHQHPEFTSIARIVSKLSLLMLGLLSTSLGYSETFYNLTQYDIDAGNRVSLPANWKPDPGTVGYSGSLDAYWLARLSSDQEQLEISRDNAVGLGLPANFSLLAAPDNCWGMDMGFGLVTLLQPANLTVTVSGSQALFTPGFALYRGWDTSKSATRHTAIYFGTNNPLGSQGLTYVGDMLGSQAGTKITKRFDNLPAGNYEIFVTVGTNSSSAGEYKVLLETTPIGSPDPYNPVINGVCGMAANQLSPTIPDPTTLCQTGTSGQFKSAGSSRYEWLCNGIGDGAIGQRCYTLGKNGKSNQAQLLLYPINSSAAVGSSTVLSADGGSGSGKVGFRRTAASKGTRCQLKVKKNQLTIKAGGKPGQCQFTATKAASKGLNKVESYPATVFVTQ